MRKIEKVLAIFALVTITAAWLTGYLNDNGNHEHFASKMFPAADDFKENSLTIYAAYSDSSLLGYASFAEGNGYGGPLLSAVAIDSTGIIKSVSIVKSKETFAFTQKVVNGKLIDAFIGMNIRDQLIIGENVDIVSGATLTSKALIQSVQQNNFKIAENIYKIDLPEVVPPTLVFGHREVMVILIIILGLAGFFLNLRFKKILRWASLILSMVVLGFIYTIPMSLANINSFLIGYWPDWHEQLYWYLMFGVVLLPAVIKGANPYCTNICPFGAAQECLGFVGGSKFVIKGKPHTYLRWLQRFLAWGIVLIALYMRDPGLNSHEIFGAFFSLTGTLFQLILMVFVVITALFVKRPWCNYLCPVKAVTDFAAFLRNSLFNKK